MTNRVSTFEYLTAGPQRRFWDLLCMIPVPALGHISAREIVGQALDLARMSHGREIDIDLDDTGSVIWGRIQFQDKSECFISAGGISVE